MKERESACENVSEVGKHMRNGESERGKARENVKRQAEEKPSWEKQSE